MDLYDYLHEVRSRLRSQELYSRYVDEIEKFIENCWRSKISVDDCIRLMRPNESLNDQKTKRGKDTDLS